MQKYFASLRPLERRLVVGVVVVVVIVLNWWFIWPEFSDLSNYESRLAAANLKMQRYNAAVAQVPELKKQLSNYESEGQFVELQDVGVNLISTIQQQSAKSGVALENVSPPITRTNDVFFMEQVQNVNVLAPEEQLVDFLYELGSSSAMIRVSDLTLQPDVPHQRLSANIKLVASYQKNPTAFAAKNATATAK
jgi:Tfp pilus assembly protein PilO